MKIVLLLLSTIWLSLGKSLPNPILDINGKWLQSRTQYYILDEAGVGVTLASIRNEACPLDVVQANQKGDHPMPLTFTPSNPNKRIVKEFTDLNIVFSGSRICNQSNVWTLDGYHWEQIISSYGVLGNPGEDTTRNWFEIEKYKDGYKLVYWPKVCANCGTPTGHFGVTIAENGRKVLSITDDVPLKIKFIKA
ncbi:miraculin-like [Bidens hawaiensis]|uniref:miraculin-like n=1 Tax=Bidens hawaiensis TaxID=980011 RepID=UPI00404AD6D5